MNKIESGIEGFDKLLYGGIPEGRAYLVSGEPGTGKTIFTMQYLVHGLQLGEKATYISIDEKPEHVIADCTALGWDINRFLENGQLQIIDITRFFSSMTNSTGTKSISHVIDDILGVVKQSGATRLGIDPIAPLIFSEADQAVVVEYIRKLIFSLEEHGDCTTLLTSYVPVGSEKVSSIGIEEFAASGIIVLRLIRLNNKRIRTIGVRKMRGTRIDLTEYSFEILPQRGLILRQPI